MVDLRCPECLTWMQGCFSKDDMKELDRLQTAGREEIQSAYEQPGRRGMEALVDCLRRRSRSTSSGPTTSRRRAAAAAARRSAAGDRRQDRDLVAVGDLGVEAVEEADVLAARCRR